MKKFLVFVLFFLSFNIYADPEIIVDADGVSHVGGLAPLSEDFHTKAKERGLYAQKEDLLFDEELPKTYSPIGLLLGKIPNYSQGNYGTCYSFAGAYTIFLSEAINLSKLNHGYENSKSLIDDYTANNMFAVNVGITACTRWSNGGWYFEMFDNWIDKGGAYLKDVKYSGSGYRKCDFLNPDIRGLEYKIIEEPTVATIKRAVMKYGAVATAVSSSCLSKSDKVGACKTTSYNHAVTIIGWTETHWIIQNSWDSDTDNVFWYLNLNSSPYNNTYVVVKDHTDSIIPIPDPDPQPTPDPDPSPFSKLGQILCAIALILFITSIAILVFRKED